MQVVVQKTIFAQAARAGGLRSQKTLTDNLVQKLLVESGCRMSQRRDDFFAHSFSERSAHGGSLTIAAKEGPYSHVNAFKVMQRGVCDRLSIYAACPKQFASGEPHHRRGLMVLTLCLRVW